MRRRVTIEVRDGAQRKVVRLDLVVGRQLGQLRHQRPVAADRPLDQPGPRQSIQPELLAVTRRGSEDERQVARASGSRRIVARARRSTPRASRYRRNPEQLTESPSRIRATASSALTILSLFMSSSLLVSRPRASDHDAAHSLPRETESPGRRRSARRPSAPARDHNPAARLLSPGRPLRRRRA